MVPIFRHPVACHHPTTGQYPRRGWNKMPGCPSQNNLGWWSKLTIFPMRPYQPVFFPTRTIRWWHDCCPWTLFMKISAPKFGFWRPSLEKTSAEQKWGALAPLFDSKELSNVIADAMLHQAEITGRLGYTGYTQISPTRTDRFHQQIRIWIGASAMILSATRFWLLIPPWKWSKWSLHVRVFYPLQNHGFWVNRLMWFSWKMKWDEMSMSWAHEPTNQSSICPGFCSIRNGNSSCTSQLSWKIIQQQPWKGFAGGPWELLLIKCQASQTWYTFQQTWLAGKSAN